jgi:hypothetical protein
MRSRHAKQQSFESGAPAACLALLRLETDAYRLRAWLIHAYDLLDSDSSLAPNEFELLKEDVRAAADLACKLINIYDNTHTNL